MQGCLLLHGFTGNPDEVAPLAKHIQERTDWLIHLPTLPGHEADGDLREVTWQDWLQFAEAEFQHLQQKCTSVYVVGFSMGGLIALYLSVKYTVPRLVLLAPALFQLNTPQLLEDFVKIFKEYPPENPAILDQLERYKRKITTTPLRAVYQFKKLVKEVTPYIPYVDSPVLIIQGKKDDVVVPDSAKRIYSQVSSEEKELLYLPESKHMLCHDVEKELVFQAVSQFLLKGSDHGQA